MSRSRKSVFFDKVNSFCFSGNFMQKNSTRRSVMRNTHIVGATVHDVITNLKKGLLHDLHILLEYIHTKSRLSMPNDSAPKCHDMSCVMKY